MTLKKSDLQDFFKRLRYYEAQNKVFYDTKGKAIVGQKPIKYYGCGEYGSIRSRPHFHIIAFNIVSHESINKAWTLGEVDIQECNEKTIDYTLKYINKKGKVGNQADDTRLPEFSLMSKRLGSNFLEKGIVDFYNNRLDINYVVNDKGIKIGMPRYYRDKMLSDKQKTKALPILKAQIEEAEAKDKRSEKRKQENKFGRQNLMNNYSKRSM